MDPVFPHGITRRSALALGAAGIATLANGGPQAVASTTPIEGLTVGPAAFGEDGLSAAIRPAAPFGLLGVLDPRSVAGLHVRTRRHGGRWGAWTALHAGHAPDGGAAPQASDPLWTGASDELQLRVPRRPRSDVRLRLVAIETGRAAHAARRNFQAIVPVAGAPAIVPRAAWGGDQVVPRAAPIFGSAEVAFVHHTEGGNVYTPEQAPGIVLAIAHYHRDTKGWNDVGYNFLVDRYGTIYEGRAGGIDHAVVGAHAQGFNRFSTGIAILGSFTSELPPDAALAAVARLIAWKLPLHGTPVTGEITVTAGGGSLSRYGYGAKVPLQRISGHRDGDSTDCPGTALYGQLPALRARTAAAVQIVPAAPRVALTGPATTPFGTLAQVTGSVVNPDGSPAVAAAVAIQKIGPSGAWSTITRVQAATDGTFAAAVPARRAGTIRARALQQTSPPLTVGVTPVLQARVDLPLVALGRAFHVRGSVGPAGPVRVVVERRETGGAWQPALVQTVVVGRSGRFAATVRLARRGHFRVTVTTLAPSAAVTAGPFPVRIVSPERLGGVATPR